MDDRPATQGIGFERVARDLEAVSASLDDGLEKVKADTTAMLAEVEAGVGEAKALIAAEVLRLRQQLEAEKTRLDETLRRLAETSAGARALLSPPEASA